MLKCYNSLPFSLMGHILSGLLSHSLLVTDIDSSWHWQRQFWAPLKQVQLRAMYDPLSFLQKIVSWASIQQDVTVCLYLMTSSLPSPKKGSLGTSTLPYSSGGLDLICLIHYRLVVWPGANHFGPRPQGDLGRTQILATLAYPIPNFLLVGMCKIASALIRPRQFLWKNSLFAQKCTFVLMETICKFVPDLANCFGQKKILEMSRWFVWTFLRKIFLKLFHFE